jgi:RNA polymerase sigma-70 factor, ECF subfamily
VKNTSQPTPEYSGEDSQLLTSLSAKRKQLDYWLSLAVAGDLEAFGELYQVYVQPIYRYFLHRVGNPAESEDLTAQVFLKAWQAIGNYQIRGVPFLAWLYRIAYNELLNYQRARRRRVENEVLPIEREQLNNRQPGYIDEDIITSIRDDNRENNPYQYIFRKDQSLELYQALTTLPEEQQQVIYFRFIEGWSHVQIAALLAKNEGTVRGIQYRALQTLAKILDKESLLGE